MIWCIIGVALLAWWAETHPPPMRKLSQWERDQIKVEARWRLYGPYPPKEK